MENRPHIVVTGRSIPSDIEDKFLKWQDEVYSQVYVNVVGVSRFDRYRVVKKTVEYPEMVAILHFKDRGHLEGTLKHPARIDLQKDLEATFYRLEQVWHDAFVLIRSFRNDASSRDSTFVENAPLIHLEGYRVPPAEQGRFDQWFARWASRVYVPILMKSPGLKAYNCFKLSDLSIRWQGRRYIETEIPNYISILYFEDAQSLENYETSLEYTSFKRHMEFELANSVSTIWNVQYQMRKSVSK